MRRLMLLAALPWLAAATMGMQCGEKEEELTLGEATLALTEVGTTGQDEQLLTVSVDLSTDFTIGEGVEKAAEELREFAASQLPCATVTYDVASVSVDFGDLNDDCKYRGESYGGTVSWTVVSATPEAIEVRHEWSDFHNPRVRVTGTANVTWDLQAITRRVVHQADWTAGAKTWSATGDRTQSLLDESMGIWGGIRIDGQRDWTSESGEWNLAINAVEVKWDYATPRAGSYVLTTPAGKTMTLTYEAIDDTTTRATITGTRAELVFNVTQQGIIAPGG